MAGEVVNIKVCSPLKLRSGLIGKYHAICHYSYNLPLCVILAANAVKTKRLRISEPSFYHFIFLKNLYNKSILFEQRIGIAS
ncbi:MAG: hypothetical protein NXI26_26705, partial [bacterium]|nr:hypothetical protein [bacterium]